MNDGHGLRYVHALRMVIGPSGAGLFYGDVLELVRRGWLSEEALVLVDRDRLLDDARD